MLSQAKQVWLGRQDGLGKRFCKQQVNKRLGEGNSACLCVVAE